MEINELQQKLHDYISAADERQLSALYEFAEDNGMPWGDENRYDEATLNMLYERRENHRKGISKSYTVEESMKIIRQHKKQN